VVTWMSPTPVLPQWYKQSGGSGRRFVSLPNCVDLSLLHLASFLGNQEVGDRKGLYKKINRDRGKRRENHSLG
jgi:hypothetical protein